MARESDSPFNVWWAGSAILLVLVLMGGVFLGVQIARHSGDENTQSEAPKDSGPGSAETGENKAPSPGDGCEVPVEDTSYPTKAPPTDWELYNNTYKQPVSDDFGPVKREGTMWRCFAHSPKGALFAGLGLLVDFSVGEEEEAALKSPKRDRLHEEQVNAAGGAGSLAEVSGFKIVSYEDNRAQISYLMQLGNTKGTVDVVVVWNEEANDWRLDFDAQDPNPEQVSEAEEDTYTDWG